SDMPEFWRLAQEKGPWFEQQRNSGERLNEEDSAILELWLLQKEGDRATEQYEECLNLVRTAYNDVEAARHDQNIFIQQRGALAVSPEYQQKLKTAEDKFASAQLLKDSAEQGVRDTRAKYSQLQMRLQRSWVAAEYESNVAAQEANRRELEE